MVYILWWGMSFGYKSSELSLGLFRKQHFTRSLTLRRPLGLVKGLLCSESESRLKSPEGVSFKRTPHENRC